MSVTCGNCGDPAYGGGNTNGNLVEHHCYECNSTTTICSVCNAHTTDVNHKCQA